MKIMHLLYSKFIDNGMSKCTNLGPRQFPPLPPPAPLLPIFSGLFRILKYQGSKYASGSENTQASHMPEYV